MADGGSSCGQLLGFGRDHRHPWNPMHFCRESPELLQLPLMKFSFIGNESLCKQAVVEGVLESAGSISMLGSFLVRISSCLPFPSLMFSWIQGSNNPLGKSAIGRKERGSSRLELY